jgi:hypothetical protein
MGNPETMMKHLIVKWNPSGRFHHGAPDTIPLHCEILKKNKSNVEKRYVFWGKISKTGNIGITSDDVDKINDQIHKKIGETHLYLYCPDSATPSLHVANLTEIFTEDHRNDPHTPSYYKDIQYPIPFWFKITDIRRIPFQTIYNLIIDDKGNNFDPVSSNFYPKVVFDDGEIVYFNNDSYYISEMEGYIMRCFKTGSDCAKGTSIAINSNQIFIGMPFKEEYKNVYDVVIKPALTELNLVPWIASEVFKNIDIMCKVCEGIQTSKVAIIDISGWNANVLFELGIVFGLSKEAIILKEMSQDVPVDLKGIESFLSG